jgi:anti-sigma factor RsiW
MSNHLSQERFETCVLREAGPSEMEHLCECPDCRVEVARFSKGLALFRKAVRDLADDPVVLQEIGFTTSAPAAIRIPRWRWTLATAGAAAALVAAIVLPFFLAPPKPITTLPAEVSPEAVMERLNRHLAGTVPEPMEPIMSLISGEQPGSERGEAQ